MRPSPFYVQVTLSLPGGEEVIQGLPVQHRYEGDIFSGEKRSELLVGPGVLGARHAAGRDRARVVDPQHPGAAQGRAAQPTARGTAAGRAERLPGPPPPAAPPAARRPTPSARFG